MKIGVLTSSRADYSIYRPLLQRFNSDPFFSLSIIVFGTHLSQQHGYTIKKIQEDNFHISHALKTLPENDSPEAISKAMGRTMAELAAVWANSNFDLVFCLGDRYEMFAACASAVPFNIKLAHLHGGEETLGAIDDAFRHSITHMSSWHFTAAEIYRQRVIALKGSEKNVYNVGSLSIENFKTLQLFTLEEFAARFRIDLSIPTILITFHPETIGYEKNEGYVEELILALEDVKGYQLVITMPNADTMGTMIRNRLGAFIDTHDHAIGIESFGTVGYLTCMKYCSFMLGNTSSGYIEASYFGKYVIDLGHRQDGRIITQNIRKCTIRKNEILEAISAYKNFTINSKIDIYGTGNTSELICNILKDKND